MKRSSKLTPKVVHIIETILTNFHVARNRHACASARNDRINVKFKIEKAIEKGHRHETDPEFTDRVDKIHRELAKEFGWKLIEANQSIDEVAEKVWEEVDKIMKINPLHFIGIEPRRNVVG